MQTLNIIWLSHIRQTFSLSHPHFLCLLMHWGLVSPSSARPSLHPSLLSAAGVQGGGGGGTETGSPGTGLCVHRCRNCQKQLCVLRKVTVPRPHHASLDLLVKVWLRGHQKDGTGQGQIHVQRSLPAHFATKLSAASTIAKLQGIFLQIASICPGGRGGGGCRTSPGEKGIQLTLPGHLFEQLRIPLSRWQSKIINGTFSASVS